MNDKLKISPRLDDPDNPEWTKEDFARARAEAPSHAKMAGALVRKRGRPAMAAGERKTHVSMRLSPDVIAAARASGPGWQARVDAALRATFLGKAKAAPAKRRA